MIEKPAVAVFELYILFSVINILFQSNILAFKNSDNGAAEVRIIYF